MASARVNVALGDASLKRLATSSNLLMNGNPAVLQA